MRYLILLLSMTISFSSLAVEIEKDKMLHFGVSTAIGATSELYFDNPYKSTAVCMGVGLAKELYDEYDYGGFDTKDLLADAVGCAVGIYTGYQINVWTKEDAVGISYSFDF